MDKYQLSKFFNIVAFNTWYNFIKEKNLYFLFII